MSCSNTEHVCAGGGAASPVDNAGRLQRPLRCRVSSRLEYVRPSSTVQYGVRAFFRLQPARDRSVCVSPYSTTYLRFYLFVLHCRVTVLRIARSRVLRLSWRASKSDVFRSGIVRHVHAIILSARVRRLRGSPVYRVICLLSSYTYIGELFVVRNYTPHSRSVVKISSV